MAPHPTYAERAIRRDLEKILQAHADRETCMFKALGLGALAALFVIPYLFFHFGGEVFWLLLVGGVVALVTVGVWVERLAHRSVEAFDARFPQGRPEREIALQILATSGKDDTGAELFRALGGGADDDRPADEKIQEALQQLDSPAPVSSPASVSKPAPRRLGHMPLQPEEHRSLEESNDEAQRR